MERTYAFVDGAAFEIAVAEILGHFGASFDDINWQALTKNCDRIFYFDALPEKKQDIIDDGYTTKLAEKQAFFEKLRRVPNLHVREGFTRLRDASKKPTLTQKGVDIALVVEVLLHTQHGNIETARVFANDLDFYPLMEALTGTRVRSELYFNPVKTSKELIGIADVAFAIDYYFIYSALSVAKKSLWSIYGIDINPQIHKLSDKAQGKNRHGDVNLYQRGDTGEYILKGRVSAFENYVHGSNSDRLLKSHFDLVASDTCIWE
jgi:hypothetical protein